MKYIIEKEYMRRGNKFHTKQAYSINIKKIP